MTGIYLGRPSGRYHNSIVMDGARIRVINKLRSRELVARTMLVGWKKTQQGTAKQNKAIIHKGDKSHAMLFDRTHSCSQKSNHHFIICVAMMLMMVQLWSAPEQTLINDGASH